MDCCFSISLFGHEAKFQLQVDQQSQQIAALYRLRELLQICNMDPLCNASSKGFAGKRQKYDSDLAKLQSMCRASAASPPKPRIEAEGKLRSLDLESDSEARAPDRFTGRAMKETQPESLASMASATTRRHSATSGELGMPHAPKNLTANAGSFVEGCSRSKNSLVSDSKNVTSCQLAPIEAQYEPRMSLLGQRRTRRRQCNADAACGAGVESEPGLSAQRQGLQQSQCCSAEMACRPTTRRPSSSVSILRRLLPWQRRHSPNATVARADDSSSGKPLLEPRKPVGTPAPKLKSVAALMREQDEQKIDDAMGSDK
eukprot:TRINITY_DN12322_c1_g1_i1.p1 TRINITY_DN12322_c1_g1~~TRINITY_DN12322_c1_g1_i1.p1  ORF type:complete len:315 (-),score=62.00 TRINITY_DN12322_c1_g1_i1:432-1376(-)